MNEPLKGKKTYISSLAAIFTGIGCLLNGYSATGTINPECLTIVFIGLIGIFNRLGVEKING